MSSKAAAFFIFIADALGVEIDWINLSFFISVQLALSIRLDNRAGSIFSGSVGFECL